MKKMFVVFGMMMVLPALADPTIGYDNGSYTYNETTTDGSNMCVNNVLETYSGTANLTAQWEANEIKLRWYNNNTQIIPSTESQTCDYAGALTLPANPTRTGYTFAGWHVRPLTTFSNSGLGMTGTGLERWGKGHVNGTTTPYCYHAAPGETNASHVDCNSDPHFTELNNDEWQMRYDDNGKTLYGMGYCSGKSGNNSDYTWPQTSDTTIAQWQVLNKSTLESASGEKKYCWCKATGYKSSSSAEIQGSVSPLAWVFRNDLDSASSCAYACAYDCAYRARSRSAFRAALFLPVENTD